MQKKIGDLTLNEILKICKSIDINTHKDCPDCPLNNTMVCVCEINW